jgi:(1->4)-alpha-D-glucan 1-alpha-D-glucosylmutase
VDPDNRRPVDYPSRRALLASLQSIDMDACVDRGLTQSLIDTLQDGRCKLFLTWKVLQFRRQHEALFRDGDYVPLRVVGQQAANVCAFARRHEGKLAITIAPRLYLRLLGERPDPPLGESIWGDTAIELPKEVTEPLQLRGVLDGQSPPTARVGNKIVARVAEALAHFPVGLLAGS